MRVLICGSRDWPEEGPEAHAITGLLTGLYEEDACGHMVAYMAEFVVIEGGARGADRVAQWWAKHSPFHSHNEHPDHPRFVHLSYPAEWEKHSKAAGFIRNQQMLDEGNPDVVFAFVTKPLEESRGTADMVRRATKAGVPVYVVSKAVLVK